jgi:hypothetical protein
LAFCRSHSEAFSHFKTEVAKKELGPVKNSLLLPLPDLTRTPQTRGRLFSIDTNPLFLDSPVNMPEDRCSRCHRYKKNAPSPELSHVGSQGESKCKLDHYPSPCDYTDENGEVCNAESNETIDDEPATKENVRQMEEKFSQQSLDLDRMRSEMEEMRKMMGSMRMTASPRDSLVTTTATTPAYSTVFSANSTVPQPSVVHLHQVRSSAAGILTSEAQSLLLANDRGGMLCSSWIFWPHNEVSPTRQDYF